MAKTTWTITGRVMVEESAVSGVEAQRPLANVEVEVSASSALGVYDSWGKVRTDTNGNFTLRKEKDRDRRKIKVKVRFADSELEINSGALGDIGDALSPWIEIFEHANEVEGPTINIGTKWFKSGGAGELGDLETRRRAISWYICKKLINTLQDRDPYFDFKGKIKVIYPANNIGGTSYANGVTRSVYIHKTGSTDQWTAQTVLHEVMHLWNYDHNHGTANWLSAIICPPDFDTHAQSERLNIAFHEGFAEFASWELLWELWGSESGSTREKQLPYNRYALVHELHLDTVDEVEQSDNGVFRALCLLVMEKLYDHKFGTKDRAPEDSGSYPKLVRPNEHDCPYPKTFATIWDVLKVFQANSNKGYSNEWEVGSRDYGVRRFIDRAGDILDDIDNDTKNLMLSLIDPNSEEQPEHERAQGQRAAGKH